MRPSISGFGALLGVLALVGCGSAENEEYLRKANAICASAAKRLGESERPSSLARVAARAEREIAVREVAVTQLGELIPPKDVVDGANEVLAGLETRQERAEAVKKAAEDKQRAELRKIERQGRREFGLEAGHAEAVGLRECAEL